MRGIIAALAFLFSTVSIAESPCKNLINEGLENFVIAEHHLVSAAKKYRKVVGPISFHEKPTKCESVEQMQRMFDTASAMFDEAQDTFTYALVFCETDGIKEASTWVEHTITSHNIARRYQSLVAEYLATNCN